MATFNATTAREEARASEIAHCFESCGIEILGIQEHRRVHEDPVVFSRLEGQANTLSQHLHGVTRHMHQSVEWDYYSVLGQGRLYVEQHNTLRGF